MYEYTVVNLGQYRCLFVLVNIHTLTKSLYISHSVVSQAVKLALGANSADS